MRTIIFVFLFSLLSITPVNAMTGNSWLEICEKNQIICGHYLMGLRDMTREGMSRDVANVIDIELDILPLSTDDDSKSFFHAIEYHIYKDYNCEPKGATYKQLYKIFKKKLSENPEILHKEMSRLFVDLMKETFPCKEREWLKTIQ